MGLVALIVSIINLIALIVSWFLLRSHLPSYFSEKGKNLTSKEDIAEITRFVESVKAQNSTEVEKIKAALFSEGKIVERRRRVYEEVYNSLRTFISGQTNSQESKERFHSAYASAWFWASDPVLGAPFDCDKNVVIST